MLINNITEAIGNTPIIKLNHIAHEFSLKGEIYAKLEMFNPFSVKDRAALEMLDRLGAHSGDVVIEPTSGNTGIGLACVCAARGIRLIAVMPENMTAERVRIMKILGAEVDLTPAKLGMEGAVAHAYALADSIEAPVVGQFDNPANPDAHYKTTATEIERDIGIPDAFIAGVGTGGTFSGVSRYFKEKSESFKAFAVEPFESAVISGEERGAHGIAGIGAGFVPQNFDKSLCDGVIKVKSADAVEFAKTCAKLEGVAPGISGGAALKAAIDYAKTNTGRTVIVFPDSIDRYLSLDL